MPGQYQRRSQPQSNGQELWAKDRTMASMNAATVALGILQLEQQLNHVEEEGLSPEGRFEMLYEKLFALHLQKGGDVGGAVATVTRAFPGSTVGEAPGDGPGYPAAPPVGGGEYAEPQGSGPGAVVLDAAFKKHAGKTIAQVYAIDPSYIRNFIAEKARDWQLKQAAQAFLAQVDAA